MVRKELNNVKFFNPNLFKEQNGEVYLVGQKCRHCGHISYPRKRVCPECFSEELDEHLLSRRGTLHTFCCTYLGVPHLEGPYVNGYVDLPEKIRLFSLITDCDPEGKDLRCDMPVETVVDTLMKDESGDDVYTYKFRPIKE